MLETKRTPVVLLGAWILLMGACEVESPNLSGAPDNETPLQALNTPNFGNFLIYNGNTVGDWSVSGSGGTTDFDWWIFVTSEDGNYQTKVKPPNARGITVSVWEIDEDGELLGEVLDRSRLNCTFDATSFNKCALVDGPRFYAQQGKLYGIVSETHSPGLYYVRVQ